VQVGEDEKARLREASRAEDAPWWFRERIEMVLLSSAGWPPPQIAGHLGWAPETVRRVLKAFAAKGLEGLHRGLPGPEPDIGYQVHVERTLESLLAQSRTWTSSQLSEALTDRGLVLSPRQVRRYLDGMGARWRRTKNTVEQLVAARAAAKDEPRRRRARAEQGRLADDDATGASNGQDGRRASSTPPRFSRGCRSLSSGKRPISFPSLTPS
jgi:transposase